MEERETHRENGKAMSGREIEREREAWGGGRRSFKKKLVAYLL